MPQSLGTEPQEAKTKNKNKVTPPPPSKQQNILRLITQIFTDQKDDFPEQSRSKDMKKTIDELLDWLMCDPELKEIFESELLNK